jgi:uncharacterized protein YqgV (UPF0045/DUF77 family)
MEGWIKLHRSIVDWEWYDEPKVFCLFLHCLFKANHTDKQWRGSVIKRGTFITSHQKLADETKLSVKQVRTILGKLKGKELAIKSNTQYTVIEVVKYDDYQTRADEGQTNGHSKGNQRATTKNDNNKKNNNKAKPKDLESVISYMKDQKIAYPEDTAQSFIDHYEANGWMRGKSKVKDWKACVRTWKSMSKQQNKGIGQVAGGASGRVVSPKNRLI